MLSCFPLDVLDEIWDLIESVSEGFLTYSCTDIVLPHGGPLGCVPYSVKGFFEINEDMVQILLVLQVLFTQDSEVEDLWTDARRPVPRLWIRSAEVRGERR